MRIVVVSAHFPPNFVSGGTQQPQRLAQGLRARGHDVWVYAGWLGAERPAGTSWSETDETGLQVRWIASTPWIGWSDRRNFDNETVVADFTAFLSDVRPDIVHLHSLQSLGAGMVTASKAAGARVVVTMHDFWWCCARQFLVDRGGVPCCTVVDAGVCECEVDHTWLEERNCWLRAQLTHADMVLAPSATAVAVLAANGLAPGRLELDENGMPEAETPVALGGGLSANGAVRFVYAGGSNELKGVHVLIDACQQMADVPGWQLAAYGADEWVREHNPDLRGLPVEVLPPFPPECSDEVLAAADVLVLPSLMRESHSVLTREALSRGLAVVCSDSLGPEEVVTDGRNGLIVPTGDSRALAAALTDLASDRALVERLQATAPDVTLRSLDEQIDGLLTRYEALEHSDAAPDVKPRPIDRVLFIVGIDGAPLRYRAWLPAEGLATLGVACEVRWFTDPALREAAARADVVVVYRVPATNWVLDVLERVRSRVPAVPMLFDADDLIFDPGIAAEIPALTILPKADAELWMEGVHRYRTTMEACDAFIASTPLLARHAEAVVGLPVERFDNGVGLRLAQQSDREVRRPRAPGPVRIGYFSGTDTHDHDWAMVELAVVTVMQRHPGVELWLGGPVQLTPALNALGGRVRLIPFRPWTKLPGLLRDVDVNLSPLVLGSRFNEAKSAIKWLEAALVATPTVASPTEPFRDAIDHGVNGLLATTVEDWIDCIDELVTDARGRERLGQRARRDALVGWSPHLQGERYLEILQRNTQRIAAGRTARASTWVPVVVNEAARGQRIDPYFDDGPTGWRRLQQDTWRAARLTRTRVRGFGHRLRVSMHNDGVAGTAQKVPRALSRARTRLTARLRR
jgi:glycosyltransferase involved in cell wall biosynthesis